METAFTPWASLLGGVLIGLAASLLMLANGRIAGVSGIFAGLLALGTRGRFRMARALHRRSRCRRGSDGPFRLL